MVILNERDADRIAVYLRDILRSLNSANEFICEIKKSEKDETFNRFNDNLISFNDERRLEITELLKVLMIGSENDNL